VPTVDPESAKRIFIAISESISAGLVSSCHDCSEGGIAVAAAEMAFAGGLGVEISLKNVPADNDVDRDDVLLFSESNSRFIVGVEPQKQANFESVLKGLPFAQIGVVNGSETLTIYGRNGNRVIDEKLGRLKESWQKTLRW